MPIRKSIIHPMEEVNMIAKLADLKEDHYKQLLIIDALTQLLIERGILTMTELHTRITQLDLLDFTAAAPAQHYVD